MKTGDIDASYNEGVKKSRVPGSTSWMARTYEVRDRKRERRDLRTRVSELNHRHASDDEMLPTLCRLAYIEGRLAGWGVRIARTKPTYTEKRQEDVWTTGYVFRYRGPVEVRYKPSGGKLLVQQKREDETFESRGALYGEAGVHPTAEACILAEIAKHRERVEAEERAILHLENMLSQLDVAQSGEKRWQTR